MMEMEEILQEIQAIKVIMKSFRNEASRQEFLTITINETGCQFIGMYGTYTEEKLQETLHQLRQLAISFIEKENILMKKAQQGNKVNKIFIYSNYSIQ